MKESDIEARLVREVRKRGGLCYKFVSPGNNGVPDRIIITPDGRVYFVELKTEVGVVSKVQGFQIARIKAVNGNVRVLKGMDAVMAFLEEVMPK